MPRHTLTFIKPLLIFLFISGIVSSQFAFDIFRTDVRPEKLTVLPASVIKVLDLGLHSAASSFFWLNTVQRAAEFQSKQLAEDLRLVTDLNPKFSYPYAFGILFLSFFEKPEEARLLGERGLREADPDWRIPYYLAVLYHTNFNDRAKALQYLELASRTPGAYEGIEKVVALYGTRTSLREETRTLWRGIYETSQDEIARERAELFLVHLEILDILEHGAEIYRKKYGKVPEVPEDLVTARILSEIPPSPLGFGYEFDETGNVRIKKP